MNDETAAMAPSYERLVELHRRLDPMGTSMLSVEQLVSKLQDACLDTKQREILACRQADKLQSDLERREFALGRALSLLRPAWCWPATRLKLNEKLRTNHGVQVRGWGDVMRWIDDEQGDATVNDEAQADKPDERWRDFSDEELLELRAGAAERHDGNKAVPAEYRERAGRLASELRKVLKARAAEPSYRGAGRYRFAFDGYEHVVVGLEQENVVLRSADGDDLLYTVPRDIFEERKDGARRYEYLGPLESTSAAVITEALRDALSRAANVTAAVAIIGERLGV